MNKLSLSFPVFRLISFYRRVISEYYNINIIIDQLLNFL